MATRYGDLVKQGGPIQITSMGQQPGPVGGDGWQLATTLPQTRLPTGVGRYAILVTGKVTTVQTFGATPQRGVVQVALASAQPGGSFNVSNWHRFAVSLLEPTQGEGIPFQFLMLQQPAPNAIADPFFGATWDNTTGSEFAIVARGYWNGDAPAYAFTCTLVDIEWLWWDMDRIPEADRMASVFEFGPPSILTLPPPGLTLSNAFTVDVHRGPTTVRTAGEKWLHFVNVMYTPPLGPTNTMPAPGFVFGYGDGSGGSMDSRVGTNGRWGMSRSFSIPGATEEVLLCQGCFWYEPSHPSGTWQIAVRGRDYHNQGVLQSTRVFRVAHFAICLQRLNEVIGRYDQVVERASSFFYTQGGQSPPYGSVYVPLERPPGPTLVQTTLLATGIVQHNGRQSYEAAIQTNTGATLDFFDNWMVLDFARFERMGCWASTSNGFGPTVPGVQYRIGFVGGPVSSIAPLDVRDVSIVQFDFVRDPIIIPPVVLPDPIAITPERESAVAIGSLPPFPIVPDAVIPEDGEIERGAITGPTGYFRTWPIDPRVRRTWSLEWSALRDFDAENLFSLLMENTTFRWAPPRRGEVAIVQVSAPIMETQGGQVRAVRARFAELIYTV